MTNVIKSLEIAAAGLNLKSKKPGPENVYDIAAALEKRLGKDFTFGGGDDASMR